MRVMGESEVKFTAEAYAETFENWGNVGVYDVWNPVENGAILDNNEYPRKNAMSGTHTVLPT